jgi:DNA-directed RNA polymerase specialized sigma subunit
MAKKDINSLLDEKYKAWSAKPTADSMMDLLREADPVLSSSIKTYVGSPDPAAKSHAKLLAAGAIKKYDPSRGVKLRSHLMTQLQPLRRFAARRRNLVKVPEEVQYSMSGLQEAEDFLRDKLARDPSDAELAEHAKISMKRLRHLRKYRSQVAAESQRTDVEGNPMQDVTQSSPIMDQWTDFVYHDLPSVDKKIMEWRMGYGGAKKLKNTEIARKLGLTPGAVSQRVAKIQGLIEQGLELERRKK